MSKTTMTNPIAVLKASNSWHSFKEHLDALKGKEKLKRDCFEELTELYLKLHPRYATSIKKVWNLRKENASRIKRKLKLPHSDEGIDLVAETYFSHQ
jgi:predicted helicase